MKEQVPDVALITITIDESGPPVVDPEKIHVRKGDFVLWNCKLNATGRMFISFDPFHSVYTEGCAVAKGQSMQFGSYQIAIDPVTTAVRHPYRVGWTPTGKNTIYVDPVIIVDPTNPTGGPPSAESVCS